MQNGPTLPGDNPNSTLTEVSPGVFYGTAEGGGSYRCGTLFTITSAGKFTKLHDFTPGEGCSPSGRLVQAGDGYLYGTTIGNFFAPEASALFRSDLSGNVTTVQLFESHNYPLQAQGPALAADGSVYVPVTAFRESVGVNIYPVYGFIFHYALDGTKSQVGPAFLTDNIVPPLVQANDGNLYGLLLKSSMVEVFRVTASGIQSVFQVADSIIGDAIVAIGQGSDNNLYFSTVNILASVQLNGRNYKVSETAGGELCQVLQTGFLLASDGQLYGGCGAYIPEVNGAIYAVQPGGFFRDYAAVFGGAVQLASASGVATQGMDGNFYGEVRALADPKSPSFDGGVYSVATGIAPPAPAVTLLTPSSGAAGSTLIIYGDHLLGATGVTFNGLPAPFQVAGVNLISVTVPAGAASSKISVTTPNGTGVSGEEFVVTE